MPDIDQLYEQMKLAHDRFTYEHWRFFNPYPKQWEFINDGATYNERLLIAGNRVGKSDTGAYELSRHLTGVYPDSWQGRRFDQNAGPVKAWAAGPSGVLVRDVGQTKLLGPPGVGDLMGSGFIPRTGIIGQPSASRSAANAFDTAHIRHISGGTSHLMFKSYEQDRALWQGSTLDAIWLDEEPPMGHYTEAQARLITTRGISFMTFTPLFGFSDVVKKFLEDDPEEGPEVRKQRKYTQMALTDAAHMSPDMIERTLAAYPRHEWLARREGSPYFSGGRVFSTPDQQLMEPPWAMTMYTEEGRLPLPGYWQLIWGIDFGIDHPFAAVLMAYDQENDTGHILAGFKMRDALILQHCDAMKRICAAAPVAWPRDGHVREKDTGEEVAALYRKHGMHMCLEHAQYPGGSVSTEAGIQDLDTAMHSNRFKVASTFSEWFQEYRMYHRAVSKQGAVTLVKKDDDLMSATRMAWMARRFAKVVPTGPEPRGGIRRETHAPPTNPWTGRVLK